MATTHWKKLTNPDYLGAYAFEPGEEKTLTIADVRREMVTGAEGKKEDCTVVYFQEAGIKPMIFNHTNCKTVERLYKTPYIEEWAGKRVILCVRQVRAFGETVDAVRVKPEKPKAQAAAPLICADCGKEIQGFNSLPPAQVAEITARKYGRPLCSECGKTAAGGAADA